MADVAPDSGLKQPAEHFGAEPAAGDDKRKLYYHQHLG
jgi:hypothetical protein